MIGVQGHVEVGVDDVDSSHKVGWVVDSKQLRATCFLCARRLVRPAKKRALEYGMNISIPVLCHYMAMPVNYVTRPTTGCLTFPVCPNARHVKLKSYIVAVPTRIDRGNCDCRR